MAYSQYRVKINGLVIPETLIARGSYNFVKESRVIRSYTDANGTKHEDVYEDKKASIKFSLRERNLLEQLQLMGLFDKTENVPVEYWDDYSCIYQTGVFKMKAPQINHKNAVGENIEYNSTPIQLDEY